MNNKRSIKVIGVLASALLLGASIATGTTSASGATTKSITCYKGTTKKIIKAVSPKCPKGWTTKKPATPKPVATKSAIPATGATAFNSTYKGTIAMLWSDSNVTATKVTAIGTGTNLGLTELSGSGSSSPASQCDLIAGAGTLTGPNGTLKMVLDTSAKGCAAESAAPTTVAITGNAVVNSGTGKYVGATGTLKINGTFTIKSTSAGSSENSTFTLTLSGNLNLK
jgi:hypothetical protein